MAETYEEPELRELGSLHDFTLQSFNKIGPTPDLVTNVNPNVVGSFVPI